MPLFRMPPEKMKKPVFIERANECLSLPGKPDTTARDIVNGAKAVKELMGDIAINALVIEPPLLPEEHARYKRTAEEILYIYEEYADVLDAQRVEEEALREMEQEPIR